MRLTVRRSVREDERGMSLVEILVALTLLAFALLALFPLFLSAVKTAASANQLTSANTLVREKLEELSGYPRSDPRVAEGPHDENDLPSGYNPSSGSLCGSPPTPYPACPALGRNGWYVYPYRRTYTVEQFNELITPVPGAPTYTVKLVTVTVRPTQGPFPGLRQTTQSLFLRLPNG
jgi:prepilin-type N-terminal cleavage/methylation domain-containing protein